jgi:large subunit ribosomal protein L15
MQLHELNPINKKRKPKRVGRGGKKGTYSGRGMKGQKSRAGRKLEPIVREIIKRYPKKRGHKQKLKKGLKSETVILNLDILEKKFKTGEKINPEILLEKKIISKVKGRMPLVKILGKGKITKELIVEGCRFSKSAKEKIEENISSSPLPRKNSSIIKKIDR